MEDKQKSLFELFERLEIPVQTMVHAPVMTVDEARQIGLPEIPCKNLFLRDSKRRFLLVVAAADTPVLLKELGKKLGISGLHFAQPQYLKEYLGVEPGSVTPFGLMNDTEHQVRVILDHSLFKKGLVGFHPLKNDATTYLAPQDLKKFLVAVGSEFVEVEFL